MRFKKVHLLLYLSRDKLERQETAKRGLSARALEFTAHVVVTSDVRKRSVASANLNLKFGLKLSVMGAIASDWFKCRTVVIFAPPFARQSWMKTEVVREDCA